MARFFVYSLLGSDYDDSPYTQTGERVARLAVSGIRLVIEEFRADVTKTRKDGSKAALRIDYGNGREPEEPVRWLWKYIDGAKTAGELFCGSEARHRSVRYGAWSGVSVRVSLVRVPSAPGGIVVSRAHDGVPVVPVPGCAAIRVRPPGDLGYWSVRDGAYELVPAADTYLRFLRYGCGRALGTTEKYAGNLAVFFDWCAGRELGLTDAARRLDDFVLMLRNQLVTRPGRGVGRPRGHGRINHILVSVREMYKSALAHGVIGEETIAALFVMGQVPDPGFSERRSRRFAVRPRHVLRAEQPGEVNPVTREEFNALMAVTQNWRDRLLLVLMRHAGLRRGEAVLLLRGGCAFHARRPRAGLRQAGRASACSSSHDRAGILSEVAERADRPGGRGDRVLR